MLRSMLSAPSVIEGVQTAGSVATPVIPGVNVPLGQAAHLLVAIAVAAVIVRKAP